MIGHEIGDLKKHMPKWIQELQQFSEMANL